MGCVGRPHLARGRGVGQAGGSRIGAVGGDIVAIHILERVDGNAVDEFVIELGADDLVELLRSEIHEVDGAEVLDISASPATSARE